MAGLAGNIASLITQKQTVKGTAATYAAGKAHKNAFAGGNIGPARETDRLSETDSSRDAGIAYVQTAGVEGEPELYVRDESIALWLALALGGQATAGTTPNFTHTLTPAASLPYFSAWKNVGNLLFEEYRDCKVSSLAVSAEAGSPLTATVGIQGAKSTRLTAAIDTSPQAIEASQVYNFNNATITLGGGATALVRSFELTIENNVTRQQTDDVEPYDVTEGTREVSLGFDIIFEALDEYNKFHYGGAAGTQISPTIFTTSAIFSFDLGVNNSVAFNLPSIAYEEFPVEPDAGGDPIVSSVRAVAQRSGSPVVTATVKNQSAAARYAA